MRQSINSILDVVNPAGSGVLDAPGTYTYQTGTNKLTHIAGTPSIDFGYDANANITSETGWTYVYDLSNQLIRVLQGANQVGEYTYNGAGQRIKKVTQTETRIFHYDLRGHLIAETNQTGQMLAEYVYLGDQLLAMIKPGEAVYYFHNDHLGTPQVLTDDSQGIAWKAVYTPFGDAVPSIQTVENPFRFPGQYYDQETGLHYNYFRYYNPQTGRYITPDPIGLEGGINLFVYVANSPVNRTDPLGLWFDGMNGANIPIGLKCKKGFWKRSWENFKTTNDVIPGILAPPLMGFLTSGKMAQALGSITLRQWASMGFRGAVLAGAGFTVLETGVVVAGTAAVNFAYVALAWEAGVGIGSLISAAIMSCEEAPSPPCQ